MRYNSKPQQQQKSIFSITHSIDPANLKTIKEKAINIARTCTLSGGHGKANQTKHVKDPCYLEKKNEMLYNHEKKTFIQADIHIHWQ